MARTISQIKNDKKRITKVIKPVNNIGKNGLNFYTAIYKLLKLLHKDLTISKESIEYLNTITNALVKVYCEESTKICKRNHSDKVDAEVIQTATKILLNGSLTSFAMTAGIKGVSMFSKAENKDHTQ